MLKVAQNQLKLLVILSSLLSHFATELLLEELVESPLEETPELPVYASIMQKSRTDSPLF